MNRGFTGVFLLILAVMLFGLHIIQAIEFSQNCSGYIKQAADANTVELAISRLDKAIDYVEKAVQWLKAEHSIEKIAMTGASTGAGYTLNCAARIP